MLKVKPFKSVKYRRWIASLPCVKCGSHYVQAAHIRSRTGGGMGYKPSDKWCFPLCCEAGNNCHYKFDKHEDDFWTEEMVDKAKDLARKLFQLWNEDEHERDATAYELIARWR